MPAFSSVIVKVLTYASRRNILPFVPCLVSDKAFILLNQTPVGFGGEICGWALESSSQSSLRIEKLGGDRRVLLGFGTMVVEALACDSWRKILLFAPSFKFDEVFILLAQSLVCFRGRASTIVLVSSPRFLLRML